MYFKLPFIIKDEKLIKNLKFDKITNTLKLSINEKPFEFIMTKIHKQKILLKSSKNLLTEKTELSKEKEIKEIFENKNLQDFLFPQKTSQKKNVKILADQIFQNSIKFIKTQNTLDFFIPKINTNFTSKINSKKFQKKNNQKSLSKKINIISISEKLSKIKIPEIQLSENQKKIKKILIKLFEKKPIHTFEKILNFLKSEKINFYSIYSLKSFFNKNFIANLLLF